MRVSQERNRVPRIHNKSRRNQDGSSQDTSYMGLEDPEEQNRHSELLRILQLLSEIHRRVQQNRKTTIRQNAEEIRWQMGMDRQGTASIRRTTKETHNSTSNGPLQPYGSNQDRNRRINIRLFWYPITTVRRWKMETSGLPIKDDARRRM